MYSPQIKQLAESIYHLTLNSVSENSCVFCTDELNKLIAQQIIPKNSALVVEPTANNNRHDCKPEALIRHFGSIAYILTGDANTFTRHINHATVINNAHPNSAMFANFEDARNWSIAKLADVTS